MEIIPLDPVVQVAFFLGTKKSGTPLQVSLKNTSPRDPGEPILRMVSYKEPKKYFAYFVSVVGCHPLIESHGFSHAKDSQDYDFSTSWKSQRAEHLKKIGTLPNFDDSFRIKKWGDFS